MICYLQILFIKGIFYFLNLKILLHKLERNLNQNQHEDVMRSHLTLIKMAFLQMIPIDGMGMTKWDF